MNRIGSLFKKDLILGIKDVFVILEIAFSVAILFLLLFVIPKDIKREASIYIYDSTNVVQNFIAKAVGLDEAKKNAGEYYVNSRKELIEGMVKDKSALGLVVTKNNDGTYNTELLTQPYSTEAIVRYIKIDMEDLLALITPPYNFYSKEVMSSVRVTALQWGLRDEIPFNKRLLPAILLMMVGILGLFIMISLIGQERSEGTIKAFKVTPAGMWEFLLSKHMLLIALGFTTFSIMYLPMIGFGGYLPALLIILLTIIFGSTIGVILGGIFDTPMAAMLWVLLIMLVLALPAISLFSPVFSPSWLKLIPSYYTLFGLDAAMFPDNNIRTIRQAIIFLGGLDIVLLFLSSWIFGKLIGREA